MRRRTPSGGPSPAALISAARARGKAMARSGALDQWSFDQDITLPYLDELGRMRDREIQAAYARAAAAHQADLDDSQQLVAEGTATRRQQENLEEQAGEALSFMQAARSEINRLARLEARRQEERSLAMPLAAGEAPDAPLWLDEPAAGEAPGAGSWSDDRDQPPPGVPDPPPAGAASAPADSPEDGTPLPGGPADPRWAGPEAPRMTRRWTATILCGLILVEVPIQYVIFQYFHGYSPVEELLTWLFTVPVSAVMVLLPHLAGWWYRDRTATGADGLMRFVPLVLLLPWAYLACMLGYLRARVLLAPPTTSGIINPSDSYLGNGSKIPSTASIVHVTPTTMSVMFVALILGVGGIGFMLGIAREHPLVGSYRGARALWQRIAEQSRGVAEEVRLADERDQALDEQEELSEEQWLRHIRGIRAAYAAAAHAYLDAVAEAVGDPMVTEAVAVMSQRIAEPEQQADDQVPVG